MSDDETKSGDENQSGIFNPNEGSAPDFPGFMGADRVPAGERKRIAEAAWWQSGGSMAAFEQLCAEHLRGEINLFGDKPTAIGGDGARATERPPGIVQGIGGPQPMVGNEHGSAAGPVADAVEAERKAKEAAEAEQAARTVAVEEPAAASPRGAGRGRSEG